ncbi:RNA-guided endonuclease InsQ/TnpB family protein [Actinacidiphila bryophytorum]|uniref:Transposase n=1 Tax=Actinacidiphila bryophytorum TaxID=1436133 RepID=A0A9W4H6R9_9ACTN|nr:transposase [Actinacidiphila bryophytorum]CAG7655110.1 transposase [Actinacidiphila bryophytorum]
MKVVVQVRLLPSPDEAVALAATLRTVNQAANAVSEVAFNGGVTSRNDLQKVVYGRLRGEFGLGAQAAVRTVKKVVDAYATLRGSVAAGLLGAPGSSRRQRAAGKPIAFRRHAAQPFDDRILSWQHSAGTVSIWTVAGRLKHVRFTGATEQLSTLAKFRSGESDLVFRAGKWFLAAVCEVPAEPLNADPVDWIGVDRGIVNLATTSDGHNYSGRRLARYRRWQAHKKAELQAKRTQSATRRLKRRAKREARHAAHINHKISKDCVAVAKRTGRGIALEELRGIRDRVRPCRDQRAALSSWPFQLDRYITYKAERAGVPVIKVDAAYTSQMCPRCGHIWEEQPSRPGHLLLSSVRARWSCRLRRRGQRAQPCTLGVGSRQRTRTARGLSPQTVDATRDRPVVGGSRERDKA